MDRKLCSFPSCHDLFRNDQVLYNILGTEQSSVAVAVAIHRYGYLQLYMNNESNGFIYSFFGRLHTVALNALSNTHNPINCCQLFVCLPFP